MLVSIACQQVPKCTCPASNVIDSGRLINFIPRQLSDQSNLDSGTVSGSSNFPLNKWKLLVHPNGYFACILANNSYFIHYDIESSIGLVVYQRPSAHAAFARSKSTPVPPQQLCFDLTTIQSEFPSTVHFRNTSWIMGCACSS